MWYRGVTSSWPLKENTHEHSAKTFSFQACDFTHHNVQTGNTRDFPAALQYMTFLHSVTLYMLNHHKADITLNSKQTGFVLCLCGS